MVKLEGLRVRGPDQAWEPVDGPYCTGKYLLYRDKTQYCSRQDFTCYSAVSVPKVLLSCVPLLGNPIFSIFQGGTKIFSLEDLHCAGRVWKGSRAGRGNLNHKMSDFLSTLRVNYIINIVVSTRIAYCKESIRSKHT